MIGSLRKRVTIQLRSKSRDEFGEPVQRWASKQTVWASITPVSGEEKDARSGEYAETSHRIVMRYGPKLRARDRLKYQGRVFDVEAVRNIEERGRFLEIDATEIEDA